MGKKYGIKCGKCDFSFLVNIGHGMRDSSFFEIDENTGKPAFHNYIRSKKTLSEIEHVCGIWTDIQEDYSVYEKRTEWHGHGSAQYICKKCGRLHNKFFFALTGSGGKYQPTYNCSSCKGKVALVELIVSKSGVVTIKSEQQIKWVCPKCKNDKLVRDNNASYIMYD
ncbi:MAG: hypothetical protein FWD47_13460 [Treponema sp.]|nr:hypothetical protein [Treponema sp.]